MVPLSPLSSFFLLRTDTARSGSSRECEKTTLFTMNWREEDGCCWVGGRHFPVSLTAQAHTIPKKCASPSEDGAWLVGYREKTLFISSRRLSFRFVVVVVRPIMKTAKRKFMFRVPCIRQAKRPPPSISSIFPSTPPRRNNPCAVPL